MLVIGPPYGEFIPNGAGGGTGGYTRNMEVYLSHLASDDFHLIPLFHTVRGQERGLKALFAVRLAVEFGRMVRALIRYRPDVVHCLGRYREALLREVMLAGLCRVFRVPLVYDIKAGAFIDAYRSKGFLYRLLIRCVIATAATLLVEGEKYRPFLRDRFGREALFFPNFVPDDDVPITVPERSTDEVMRVLFVGFCHADKGVHEIIDGCRQLAASGIPTRLTLIGAASPDFAARIDVLSPMDNFVYEYQGHQDNAAVREAMLAHDVFCFPSRHLGEGHSNAITEAMMSGMIIACSRVGFLEAVVEERGGYFFESLDAGAIAATLTEIHRDPVEAGRRAKFAHRKVREQFVASIARRRITAVYRAVTSARCGSTPK